MTIVYTVRIIIENLQFPLSILKHKYVAKEIKITKPL